MAGATRLAAPGALFLLYGFAPGVLGSASGLPGVTAGDLRRRFQGWELIDAVRGTGPWEVWWFRMRRGGA